MTLIICLLKNNTLDVECLQFDCGRRRVCFAGIAGVLNFLKMSNGESVGATKAEASATLGAFMVAAARLT
ncbi:MAG: hypothetical protein KGY54_14730, partial [Oleiphilaceae bacterium]|nr:hypothetical protein [Oleiphilaceae bacterium]